MRRDAGCGSDAELGSQGVSGQGGLKGCTGVAGCAGCCDLDVNGYALVAIQQDPGLRPGLAQRGALDSLLPFGVAALTDVLES